MKCLPGIDAALRAGLTPVKINMVVLYGINDSEVDDFIRYVRGNRNLVLQLIELMHFNDCDYHGDFSRRRSSTCLTRKPGAYPKDASPEKILH